jgi:hypothetical protein
VLHVPGGAFRLGWSIRTFIVNLATSEFTCLLILTFVLHLDGDTFVTHENLTHVHKTFLTGNDLRKNPDIKK